MAQRAEVVNDASDDEETCKDQGEESEGERLALVSERQLGMSFPKLPFVVPPGQQPLSRLLVSS